MNECLTEDTIVSLGNAVSWKLELLRHVNECHSCKSRLRQLGKMTDLLAEEVDPGPGFAAGVMSRLPEAERPVVHGLIRILNLVATPALAGLTTFFVVALAAQTGSDLAFGFPMVIVAIVVTVGTLAWNATDVIRSRPTT